MTFEQFIAKKVIEASANGYYKVDVKSYRECWEAAQSAIMDDVINDAKALQKDYNEWNGRNYDETCALIDAFANLTDTIIDKYGK